MALGASDFVPFNPKVPTAKKSVGTRREWRIKQKTGELRGVSIRERNKDRKPAGWIDKDSPGWGEILASYARWQRTARYAVGTLEQCSPVPSEQPTGKDNGNVPDASQG